MTPINAATIEDKLFRLNENIKFIDDILEKSDKDIVVRIHRKFVDALRATLSLSTE